MHLRLKTLFLAATLGLGTSGCYLPRDYGRADRGGRDGVIVIGVPDGHSRARERERERAREREKERQRERDRDRRGDTRPNRDTRP